MAKPWIWSGYYGQAIDMVRILSGYGQDIIVRPWIWSGYYS